MTTEEMRIEIAKFRGWRRSTYGKEGNLAVGGFPVWVDPEGNMFDDYSDSGSYPFPNYPEDLNAMHECVQILEPIIHRKKYPEILKKIVAKKEGFITNDLPLPDWHLINANAIQRAEAFLRVLGLYRE